MKIDLNQALLHLDSDRKELERLRLEMEKDQRIQADLQKKLADIDEAIVFIKNKIDNLEHKLAKLKK